MVDKGIRQSVVEMRKGGGASERGKGNVQENRRAQTPWSAGLRIVASEEGMY